MKDKFDGRDCCPDCVETGNHAACGCHNAPAPHEGGWEEEFENKWRHMLAHRLFHYGLQHYDAIGRKPTKLEEDRCSEYANWVSEELFAFISKVEKEAEAREQANTITMLEAWLDDGRPLGDLIKEYLACKRR